MKNILTSITNCIYLTPFWVWNYKRKNPNKKVLVYGATKARKSKKDIRLQYGLGWVVSRRTTLMLTENELICGNWFIPIKEITKSQIQIIKSIFGKGYLLIISTSTGDNYQFGLMSDKKWLEQDVLNLEKVENEFTYSLFSKLIRICILIWIVKLIIDSIR